MKIIIALLLIGTVAPAKSELSMTRRLVITLLAGINAGAHEINPLLTNPGAKGNINWAKLIGYKALMCGVPLAFTFAVHRLPARDQKLDAIAIAPATLAAGTFTWTTFHNLRVLSDIRRERGQ